MVQLRRSESKNRSNSRATPTLQSCRDVCACALRSHAACFACCYNLRLCCLLTRILLLLLLLLVLYCVSVGSYNLLLSLLPPTVMKVAGWVGFSGDRELGLRLLHASQRSSSFMALFSCLLLLSFYNSIPAFTGEPEDTYAAQSSALSAWAESRYGRCCLYLLALSKAHRTRREMQQAIRVAKQAIVACRELPSVSVLLNWSAAQQC